MSGYREYLNSASGVLMDLVTDAASTVQYAASATYTNMSETLQFHCNTVAERLLNYKYQDRSLMDTSPEYPDTLQPVWILGQKWSAVYDLEELRDLVQSRLWFTYRREFPCIGSSECASDQGWGCMLRCGQMLLGSCLMDLHLTRQWRWNSDSWRDQTYTNILRKFQDKKSAPYSIHQIALMGESVENKPVGTWFGPNTVVQVLRKLTKMDPTNNIVIHVAMDNMLIIREAKEACLQDGAGWKPLLLCISLRLGLTEINPVYISGLKTCLSLPQTQGVVGGKPNHALYILGFVENEAIYLDPHVTQPYVELDNWDSFSAEMQGKDIEKLRQQSRVVTQHSCTQLDGACTRQMKPCNSDSVKLDSSLSQSYSETGQSNIPASAQLDSTTSAQLDSTVSAQLDSTASAQLDSMASAQLDSSDQRGYEVSGESEYLRRLELLEREDKSFHVSRPGRIDINQLDPSLSVTFFCKTEADFDSLCQELQESLLSGEKTPLFEMMLDRPLDMYQEPATDLSAQPDESTGSDYERIDRKYDSEEEYEIL